MTDNDNLLHYKEMLKLNCMRCKKKKQTKKPQTMMINRHCLKHFDIIV